MLQVFAAYVYAIVDGVCNQKWVASLLLGLLWLKKVAIGGVRLRDSALGNRVELFSLILRGLLAGVVTVAPCTFKFLYAVRFRSLY